MEIRLSRRGNPVAAAPILRKGGVHQKSKTGERTQSRKQLKRETTDWQPLSGVEIQPVKTGGKRV